MTDRLELLLESPDAVELDHLAELLREEGIEAVVEGVRNPALIGVAAHIVPLRLLVPAEEAARARELLDDLSKSEKAEEAAAGESAAPESPGENDSTEAMRARRRPAIAIGAAFVIPGGSHFYAQCPVTAFVLIAGWTVVIGMLLAGAASEVAALAIPSLLLVDLLGGLRAALGYNKGRRKSRWRQAARGVVLLVLAGGGVVLFGLIRRLPEWQRERELARFALRCGEDEIEIKNLGDETRAVTLELWVVARRGLLDEQREQAWTATTDNTFRLDAGQSMELAYAIPEGSPCRRESPAGGFSIVLAPELFFVAASPDRDLSCELIVVLSSGSWPDRRVIASKTFGCPLATTASRAMPAP
jgi:hypothetical protein